MITVIGSGFMVKAETVEAAFAASAVVDSAKASALAKSFEKYVLRRTGETSEYTECEMTLASVAEAVLRVASATHWMSDIVAAIDFAEKSIADGQQRTLCCLLAISSVGYNDEIAAKMFVFGLEWIYDKNPFRNEETGGSFYR